MHRTQIYFEEELFAQLKQAAQHRNVSVSAYIREVLRQELAEQKKHATSLDFSRFAGLWESNEVSQEAIRSKAWK